jgi:hypothetical protein
MGEVVLSCEFWVLSYLSRAGPKKAEKPDNMTDGREPYAALEAAFSNSS